MRHWTIWVVVAVLLASGIGCVDTFDDTRIQGNLWVGTGLDRRFLVLPTPGRRPGDVGYFSHYEVHAEIEGMGYVRLANFLIQPALHADNPCLQFTPDDFCVPAEYECDPWVNMVRYEYLEDIFAVISPGETFPTYAPGNPYEFDHRPGYDFMSWPDHLFVDPLETNPASKLARSNLWPDEVQEFCEYCLPPGFYLGNPRLLTSPLHGELFGVVDGRDPRTGATVGGFALLVPGKLDRMTALLVLREPDPSRLAPENIQRQDLPPSGGSQIFLIARSDESLGYIRDDMYRGVTTARLENPYSLPVFMDVVIFGDIDEDPIGI
jgi:hypothetical protein